jgi:RNA polymerase sigma factor (sigma-70 family)
VRRDKDLQQQQEIPPGWRELCFTHSSAEQSLQQKGVHSAMLSDPGDVSANQQVRILRKELAQANEQLQAAVGQALEQKSQDLAQQREANRIKGLLDSLKPRDREVFLLITEGLPNKRIAGRLGVSLQTVKLHRSRVMQKLQLHSVAELVRLAEKARSLLSNL